MTLHGIALGKSAISGSLFCAVFRTVTKHDITKATLIGLVAIVLWSTMVGLIRGVSEGLGPVGGAAMIYSLSGLLLIFTVGLPDIRRFPGDTSSQAAYCLSVMKYARRFLSVMPPLAIRLSKSAWLTIYGPA